MPVTGQRKTPGVYVTEIDAFPPSIIGVETAIPAFIGYTEKAEISNAPMYFKPVRIRSFAEYVSIFGESFMPRYDPAVVEESTAQEDPDSFDVSFLGAEEPGLEPEPKTYYYKLNPVTESQFFMYRSMKFFFSNGGQECYIVSVGNFTNFAKEPKGVKITDTDLLKGLEAIAEQVGPTMLVVPDATLLPADDSDEHKSLGFNKVIQAMLTQSEDLQDRVAILDVWGANTLNQDEISANNLAAYDKLIENFRAAAKVAGTKALSYGMAYFPFLNTSTVAPSAVTYLNFALVDPEGENKVTLESLRGMLTYQANLLYPYKKVGDDEDKATYDAVKAEIDAMPETADVKTEAGREEIRILDQNLRSNVPILVKLENIVSAKLGLLPPSGAMAGIFTKNDNTKGVWNAPANVSVADTIKPNILINSQMQENLNVPLTGESIVALREFTGRGTVVWGARTMDGNSNDWRYIQVRRTIIYIEQSIKTALQQFVFAPNTGETWVTVVSAISNFLQGLWSQGGLMGSTASEAFSVECGLGSTMTAQDILEGYMNVQVTLQMVRPAEFIELSFTQKMEG